MAGGSQIILSSDGITIKMPKEFKVFAGQHKFEGGEKVSIDTPVLPKFNNKNWIALEHLDVDNQPFSKLGYKIYFEGNQIIEGKLDEQGKAHHDNVPEKAIKVEYEQSEIKDKPWDTYDLVLNELNSLDK